MSIRSIVTLGFFDTLLVKLGFGATPVAATPTIVYLDTRSINRDREEILSINRDFEDTRILEVNISNTHEL